MRAFSIAISLILGFPVAALAQPLGIHLDDGDPGVSISNEPGLGWHRLVLSSANQGDTFRTFNNGATAAYKFSAPSGTYDVHMRWPVWSGTLPDGAAPVAIQHAAGVQAIGVDQRRNGGKWNLVGRWAMGSNQTVTISNRGQGPVYADAVRLTLSSPAEDPCAPTSSTTTTTIRPASTTTNLFPVTTTTLKPRSGGGPIVGLNIQQHAGNFDGQGEAFVRDLGVQSIRVAYNHGDHDYGVNWAAPHGIGVLFMLGYSDGCNPLTPAGRQCCAERSGLMALNYGRRVQFYEVWNEWNGGFGLGCDWREAGTACVDAAMYTDLLCRTHKAIKQARPTAVVVGGATAGIDIKFITEMLDAGAGNCMDMISVHSYVYGRTAYSVPYDSPPHIGVNKFIESVTDVHNLVKRKTGKDMQILITEGGRNDQSSRANEQLTADYLTELFKRMPDFVAGFWWFQLEDQTRGQLGWGLVRSDNTKKPSYAAFKAAAARAQSGLRIVRPTYGHPIQGGSY